MTLARSLRLTPDVHARLLHRRVPTRRPGVRAFARCGAPPLAGAYNVPNGSPNKHCAVPSGVESAPTATARSAA